MSDHKKELASLRKELKQLKQNLHHRERELSSIQQIGKALSSTLNLDELLALIIGEITTLMGADRCTLFIVDHKRREIWSKIALKAEVKEIRLPLGRGIAGHVALTGDTINIPDAYQDDRFDPATDKRTGYRTRSILCMPVWDTNSHKNKRRIIGVIQVLNKEDGHFTAEDEALLEALSSQAAISISNAGLYQRLEKKVGEMGLLHEFEQMLNATFELPVVLKELMARTVKHLDAHRVITFFPLEGRHILIGADAAGGTFSDIMTSVPLGWVNLVQQPSRELLQRYWPAIHEDFFHAAATMPSAEATVLYSHFHLDEAQNGIVIALDVKAGRMQEFADERMMLELVAQKVLRARELHNLRESLIKRERLSAIGQLMSTIVHDIRSPVNTIYGFVDLMGDETTSGEERIEFADIIRDEIKSVMNMVTEVLDFAKGKTNILPRKSSVKNIIKRYKPRVQQMCQSRETTLEFDVDQEAVLLYADEEKLNRVFYNITKNALEAMGEGGTFTFRTHSDPAYVTFRFTDTGPGIPRDIQDRLFDSFVTSGKESGTGLGLAIVKKIVDEHGGHIEIDSQVGSGATFTIRLPVLNP